MTLDRYRAWVRGYVADYVQAEADVAAAVDEVERLRGRAILTKVIGWTGEPFRPLHVALHAEQLAAALSARDEAHGAVESALDDIGNLLLHATSDEAAVLREELAAADLDAALVADPWTDDPTAVVTNRHHGVGS